MEKIEAWQASDGKIFGEEIYCKRYEEELVINKKLIPIWERLRKMSTLTEVELENYGAISMEARIDLLIRNILLQRKQVIDELGSIMSMPDGLINQEFLKRGENYTFYL